MLNLSGEINVNYTKTAISYSRFPTFFKYIFIIIKLLSWECHSGSVRKYVKGGVDIWNFTEHPIIKFGMII